MARKKLTEKERIKLFIRYYPKLKFNGTKAAIEAGYSKKSARAKASQLLAKVNVQKAIKKQLDNRLAKIDLNQDSVLLELKKIGFSDIKDYVNIDSKGVTLKDLEYIDTSAVQSIKVTKTKRTKKLDFKMYNKINALELLGRHFNTFNDSGKLEIDLSNFKVIFANIDFVKPEEKVINAETTKE
jgi:phage terminase small subunit